jgi:hypothetical protein
MLNLQFEKLVLRRWNGVTQLPNFSTGTRLKFCIPKHKVTGQCSRYGDWLWAKSFGVRNPVEEKFSAPV